MRIGNAHTARRTPVAFAAAGLVLAATALSPAASAATVMPTVRFDPAAQHQSDDSNWGGYVTQGSFTRITGSWTEPHVVCRSDKDMFAPWVGLDGWGSPTVEQAGVQTDCSSGSPVNTAWYEMYPAQPVYWNDPVSEGDSMTATVTSDGSGGYSLTLTDNTKGWTEHVDKTLQAGNVSAEAVIESPDQAYPELDSVRFSQVTVDGGSMGAMAPEALTSGGYTPGPMQNDSFTLEPGNPSPQPGNPYPQPGNPYPQPGNPHAPRR
jgi:Peptidase A4 family